MITTKNDKVKILYVEDDDITRENAIEYLENYFVNIYEAKDGLEALKKFEQINPDIIITDIQMPKVDGLEFIKSVRQKNKEVQVIVITAFSHKEYLLKAIELQLVKYLMKPIKENELKDALELCVNNLKNSSTNIIKLNESSVFDKYNHTLLINDKLIKLRIKETDLLTLLLNNKDRYVTYEEIENYVWKDFPMTKDALKTLVKYLKQKISKDIISNQNGVGYKINV
ncbi:response regulator receiver protein [Arcobacter nitrofigilis DSM 7299]|uniref:Response regulator receiver protein n=1 Tax=Arcobacter nitrofigilis (strain ATCC 33309 / DSM 7299 / CCUG 15893 / LMG 7604 / NCTC 12251 / CI) TaxID=572480 RepID=D5V1V4_ARCNC|nr:response regulator [Arcobacter nitrofigilis]ADG93538.1 response regulator receiver protein [Arcobacter nitrofigilis DSM 7299]